MPAETITTAYSVARAIADGFDRLGDHERSVVVAYDDALHLVIEPPQEWAHVELTIRGRHFTVYVVDDDVLPDLR